ncbi:hypothetical protein K227x_34830 [Rubripirellula lacrimiformis]|uniref:Uncharacterized protein n=1 Tax=Rubripirellula lacrimiformis TaxID=1930273 RepID=A0A517ND74_9BACT|nr:hypothetical protein [Rubripirellula lacrimiformis]QDT05085.1 hypothetical protein K227x_34830 [Rubripirellula lacrimiformis]
MSSISERPRGLKRKWLDCLQKAAIGFFVITIGTTVSLLIVVAIRQGGAKTRVTDMKQAVRRAGLPIDPVSLETYRGQLAAAERAKPWGNVIGRFRPDSGYPDRIAGVPRVDAKAHCQPMWAGEPWAEREKVRRFLDETATLRHDLAKVLESAGPIYTPMTYDGIDTMPPAAGVAHEIASLLALQNLVAIDRGDIDASEQSVEQLFALERTLQGELMVLPQLIRLGVVNVALHELRRVTQIGQWQPDQIDRLLTDLGRTLPWDKAFRQAMIGERVVAVTIYDDGTLPNGIARKLLGLAGPRDQFETLSWYEQFLALPTDDPVTFLRAAAETNADMESTLGSANIWRRVETMTTGVTLPALRAIAVTVIRTEENIRLARLALVCQRFEIDRGRWPSSHEEAFQFAQEEMSLPRDSIVGIGPLPFGVEADGSRLVLWGKRIEGFNVDLQDQPPESYWPDAWRELPPRQRSDSDARDSEADLAVNESDELTIGIEMDMFEETMGMYDADDSSTVPDELRGPDVNSLDRHLQLIFHRDQPSDSYYKWVLQPSE